MNDDSHAMDRRELRASDTDRERIAARLREAHVEGRLSETEFEQRLDSAFHSQTYGQLEPLVRDLPLAESTPTDVAPAPKPSTPERADGRRTLRGMWTVWVIAVSINLMIWLLVSISNAELTYFWPIWVAGPWGAVLLSITAMRRIGRD